MVFRSNSPSLRAISFVFAAMLLSTIAVPLSAQETEKPVPKPALPPPETDATHQPANPPQTGEGATVRTGSVVGEGTQSIADRLALLLADHQFLDMQQMLDASDAAPDGPAKLPPQKAQLYRGILANRANKPEESIKQLQPLLNQIKSTDHPPEEKLLRKAIAEDYLRLGDWASANQAYLEYQYRIGGSLTQDEKDELELPLNLLPLARQNPPMTVEPGEPFALPYDRDALGLTDVPVFVDAQSHDWMLDPTAPFNLICRSTAKEVGLKVSEEFATIHTLTGRPMKVHVTVIPRLTVGTVTYRNMTAFVFEDADYYFPQTQYQVRGVLGYPAVSALGSIAITAQSRIEVQPGERGERITTGARFFLDGDQIIAALGKAGDERMYSIDASGQQTYLSSRYYAEHTDDFANQKMQLAKFPGAQNKAPVATYTAETVNLQVGETPFTFHFVPVLTQPLSDVAIDDTYGKLGMDALENLKSYTFDYRTMRFAITNH